MHSVFIDDYSHLVLHCSCMLKWPILCSCPYDVVIPALVMMHLMIGTFIDDLFSRYSTFWLLHIVLLFDTLLFIVTDAVLSVVLFISNEGIDGAAFKCQWPIHKQRNASSYSMSVWHFRLRREILFILSDSGWLSFLLLALQCAVEKRLTAEASTDSFLKDADAMAAAGILLSGY